MIFKWAFLIFLILKDSNEAATVTVAERVKVISPRKKLRPGYNWVDSKVRDFFSRYRSANELHDFVSNSHIYYSDVENDIISFQHVGDVDNVCHGREGDSN